MSAPKAKMKDTPTDKETSDASADHPQGVEVGHEGEAGEEAAQAQERQAPEEGGLLTDEPPAREVVSALDAKLTLAREVNDRQAALIEQAEIENARLRAELDRLKNPMLPTDWSGKHWTDIRLEMITNLRPVIDRNAGKTGAHWNPGTMGLLSELVDVFATAREELSLYGAYRDGSLSIEQQRDAAPPMRAMSVLESEDAPEQILMMNPDQLAAECQRIPDDERVTVLSPILHWAQKTGLDYPLREVLQKAIDGTPGARIINMPEMAVQVQPGQQFDHPDGRRYKCLGFGLEPGTIRVADMGPWQEDPIKREPIGGVGMTSTYMNEPH